MKNLKFKNQFLQFLRQNPLQALGTAWAVVVTGVLAFALLLPSAGTNQQSILTATAEASETIAPRAAVLTYADTVDRVSPAVVTVRSESRTRPGANQQSPLMNDPRFREFFGGELPQMQQRRPPQRAVGSGVIVTGDGTILTNNHVIEGADRIKIELPDRRAFDARVVGTDKPSDLAVLKIEATNLPTLPLGDSDRVRVGDVVLALGNPLGLQQTVTSGIISAKGRSTGISDGSFEDFLQTDAPINHGNSGGALVNLNGELIGINSQILSPSGGSIGIGFAIPSNMARGVMDQLIKTGKVQRGMLGVGIQNVTSDLAQQFGLQQVRGVIINSVRAGSPAERAGVKPADVVLKVNGANVSDSNELRNRVAQTQPGSTVELTIWRDGREQTVRATLTEFSQERAAIGNNNNGNNAPSAAPAAAGKLGVALQPLTPQLAGQIGVQANTQGLVVTEVNPTGAAAEAGLQENDVIVQINRRDVKSLADVQTALAASRGNAALLLVNRQGQTLFVTVPMK